MFSPLIESRVQVALAHKYRMALGSGPNGAPLSPQERADFLRRAFAVLEMVMGPERFAETPVERLDQFAVMSVVKNHDTAGMLRSLVNSFMIAYGCPETTDRAFQALVQIEGLRALVADSKGQGMPAGKVALEAAAKALQEQLQTAMESQPVAQPFRIVIGADRLYLVSDAPIEGAPTLFHGFEVEPLKPMKPLS